MRRCALRVALTVLVVVSGLLVLAGCTGSQQGGGPSLVGAGATFPYPLHSTWVDVYERQTGVRINYHSIGSGGGIRQLIAGSGTSAPPTYR